MTTESTTPVDGSPSRPGRRPTDADLGQLLAARRAKAAGRRAAAPERRHRRAVGDRVPLHPPQRRLWFLAGYDPGSAAYNVALELELDEAVDAARLATALRGLVERHDVLRQVVRTDDAGEPYAELVAVPDDLLTVLDGDHDEVDAELRRRARAPFDLAAGPALRCLLVRAPGRSPVLQLVVHHVATDAWSEQVLVRDLEALYAGERLPEPVQYADVAGLGLDAADDDVRWWAARLDPPPAPLTIPTDRPRPPVAPVAGAEVPVRLDAAAVAAAARRAGTTPAAVLLAATRTLLHRALGVDDVTVGLPESGRLDPAQDDVVGCFVNTLAVRGRAGEADELGRAADDLRDAMLHRAAPFDRVVEQVGPERDLSTTPLFQVLLNVHAGDLPSTGGGLVRARRHRTTGTAKFDLTLTVDAGQDEALLSYRTDLLDEQTALGWADWFAAAVRSVTDGSDLRLGEDPLLDGGAPTPLAGTLLDQVEAAAAARPAGTAVVAPDGDLRYADLWERSGALARHLVASGAAGRPVAVYVDRSADLVVGALACWRARSAYLPLDPAYPPERVAAGMSSAGCDHLLTHRALAQDVTAGTVLLLDDPAVYASAPDADLAARPTGSDLAYVISTSGSTGAPKAVAVTHDGVVDYLGGALPRLGLDLASGPSFALASTPAADLGMTCLLGALVTGGTLHLLDRSEASDPVRFARRVRTHAIDVVKLVPSHLEMLAAHGDLAAVLPERLLVLAGEAIPWTLVDAVLAARPDLAVHASYGPSETTVAVSWCDTATVPADQRVGTVPLGTPYPGVRLSVLDPQGRPLPRGLVGELAVGGPSVGPGYLGTAPETSGFVERHGERWYRTGDVVRVSHDGRIDVHGRADDQVKVRGHRIELDDVTAACTAVPGAQAAVVLPVGTAHRRRLVAWVLRAPGAALTGSDVRAGLRDRLPDYMIPSDVVVLDELPLAASGKVDRAALPAPEQVAAQRVPLSGATQERVADVWQQVLGVRPTSADDDFFALGGDSFGAVRAVTAIGGGLAVVDLFRHPTVAELAALLDHRAQSALETEPTDWPLGRPLLQQLSGPGPVRAPALTLVCLPYGGGAAIAYQPLASALPTEWDVLAAELPGHDPVHPDESLRPMDEVLDQLADEVLARTDGPVAVYGHCLGGATAAALALRLEARDVPVAGVVVGASLPATRLPGRLSRAVARFAPTDRWTPDRTYREVLGVMGGLDDPDGADAGDAARNEAMLRALRHDARQAEELFAAALEDGSPTLAAPLLVVMGEKDRTTELYEERYAEWAAFADHVELATVPRAGHYFLKHQPDQLADEVRRALGRWGRGARPAPASAPHRGRRDLRVFGAVAAAQTLSLVGTGLSGFGLAVFVLQETGKVGLYALVTMLALLPAIFLAPLGGALADRVDRRVLMLLADGAAGLSTLVLAALWWTDRLELWHVYAAVTIGSAATAFHRPAWMAAISQLVPKPYLVQANAVALLGTGLGTLLAPLAGGALLTGIGLGGLLGVDAVTFVLGAVVLLVVRFPDRLFKRQEETFRRALTGGWRFVVRRPPMVAMTVFFVVTNLLLAVPLVLAAPVALSIGTAALLGLVTAAGGLGAAVGSVTMTVWGGTRRRVVGMVGFTAGLGAGGVLMGVAGGWWLGAGLFVLWFSLTVLNAHWLALIQRKVGWELQGRVIAANQMLATAAMPVGFLLCAPLVALAGSVGWFGDGPAHAERLVLVAVGLALVVWTVVGLRWPALRDLEVLLPDARAGAEIEEDLDAVQREADLALTR